MKRLILAISSLILAVAICTGGYFLLKSTCETLYNELEKVSDSAVNGSPEEALAAAREAVELWEEIHGRIEGITRHSETDELEEIVKSLPVYAESGNMERLFEKAEIGKNRLEHIVKNEKPLLSNIF